MEVQVIYWFSQIWQPDSLFEYSPCPLSENIRKLISEPQTQCALWGEGKKEVYRLVFFTQSGCVKNKRTGGMLKSTVNGIALSWHSHWLDIICFRTQMKHKTHSELCLPKGRSSEMWWSVDWLYFPWKYRQSNDPCISDDLIFITFVQHSKNQNHSWV